MWKLKCVDNGNVVEKVVKFRNIIGRGTVRSFFASNGYAMMDCEMESITDMQKGEILKFGFRSNPKYIEVEAL
jgi:hypothetical protein